MPFEEYFKSIFCRIFKSEFIFVHTIERGSFVVKMTSKECEKPKVCAADGCLSSMRTANVEGRLQESQEFCGNFTQRKIEDERAVPDFARSACAAGGETVAKVSSACACLPTLPVPELPRTTSRPPVPTVLPPRL